MGFFDIFKSKPRAPQQNYDFQAQNDLRIIGDCLRILDSTYDRDTFNSRMELLEKTLDDFCAIEPYIRVHGSTPTQLRKAYYKDKQEIIDKFNFRSPIRNPHTDQYYEDMRKLESAWSVLQNLKLFSGEQADSFEKLCLDNIALYKTMMEWDNQNATRHYEPAKHIPAYVRLSMLYEKQEKYKEAIDICVEAIQIGAYDDHSKGKMYGRLARLIRKSGMDISPDIKKLAQIP